MGEQIFNQTGASALHNILQWDRNTCKVYSLMSPFVFEVLRSVPQAWRRLGSNMNDKPVRPPDFFM